jgi:Xaa-Pro dipeptidase
MNARIEQLAKILDERGLEAAVLKLPENLVLFSGYWPRNGFSFAVVNRSGRAALVVPAWESEDAARGSLADIRTFPWGRLADGDPWENVAAVFRALKAEYGISDEAGIGVDNNAEAVVPSICCGELLPPGRRSLEAIGSAFGEGRRAELMPDIIAMRAVKTPFEIKRIEIANQLALSGTELFSRLAGRPGMREIDIAAEVESFVMKSGAGFGGRMRYARAVAQVSSGPERTASGWNAGIVPGERVVKGGDFVMLEMGVMADGYWSDLTCTVVSGQASELQAMMMDAVEAAQAAAIAQVRPGAIARDVDAAARREIESRGLGDRFFHNLGHGTGLAYHDGGPFLSPGSGTVLESGMIHSCEPGVYIEGIGGVRQEVNVLVTADGARVLGRGL